MAKRQLEIAGTERKTVKVIDDAAEKYVDARDAKNKAAAAEKLAKDALVAAMREHKVNIYRDVAANLVVTIVPGKDNVKVQELPEVVDEKAESEVAHDA